MSTQAPSMASDKLMDDIRRLALTRDHRLAPGMLDGCRLTRPQAEAVLARLWHSPQREIRGMPADSAPEPVTRRSLDRPEQTVAAASVPRTPRPTSFFTMIPDGWYAVPSRTGNNDLDFFHVKTKQGGKWKGNRYVDRIIGGHEDQPLGSIQGRLALEAILEYGPAAAGKLYADETETCQFCPAHLTDYASRMLGMGEQCARNHDRGEEWRRLDREFRASGGERAE